jgi:hypothetical protein
MKDEFLTNSLCSRCPIKQTEEVKRTIVLLILLDCFSREKNCLDIADALYGDLGIRLSASTI